MPFPTVNGRSFFDYVEQLKGALISVNRLDEPNQRAFDESVSALFLMIEKVSTQMYDDVQELKRIANASTTLSSAPFPRKDPSQEPITTS
jgi:hypothetical protein